MATATRPAQKNPRLRSTRGRLLDTPTPLAVRRIARSFLTAARRAYFRLQRGDDAEALHDFRVALRRLRSTLRIYRPAVGARLVPRKWRRRLKRIARATGAARDAEVGLLWLQTCREQADQVERTAYDRLIETWSLRRDAAYAKLRRVLEKEFAPVDAGLRRALAVPSDAGVAPPLASTAGALMHDQVAELGATLHRIESVADTKIIHTARIDAKRLRYLLEPLADQVPHGKNLLRVLKKFQDEFGELCDRQVLSEELIAAAAAYTAEQSARELRAILEDRAGLPPAGRVEQPGLRAVAERLNAERRQRYARIVELYLGERAERLLAPYRALADSLARRQPVPKRAARRPRPRRRGSR